MNDFIRRLREMLARVKNTGALDASNYNAHWGERDIACVEAAIAELERDRTPNKPRFWVETVNGYGPHRQPRIWYAIRDTSRRDPFSPYGRKVATSDQSGIAQRIADMLNEGAQS